MIEAPVQLGKTDIRIPPMGTGAWEWGDRFMWGFGREYGPRQVEESFHASLAAGIDFFDTAELYGNGRSEKFLGALMPSIDRKVILATKFFPFPWRLTRGALHAALRTSLKRLGRGSVELYQIHQPYPPNAPVFWAEALAEAAQRGLIRAAGVSNYNADWTRRTQAALARHGLPLASNQVEYSLLDRHIERDGTMQTCRELGVTVIAYSPIAQGALTGKYTPENLPPGFRRRVYNRNYLAKIQPLVALLREIGAAHGGKTPGQVALNWVMAKDAVPIPGAKNARQAQENTGALGWRLTGSEVAALDAASEKAQK
jgi:aryl-alcohol dehydrogenase-like predicted oxidoreductase